MQLIQNKKMNANKIQEKKIPSMKKNKFLKSPLKHKIKLDFYSFLYNYKH